MERSDLGEMLFWSGCSSPCSPNKIFIHKMVNQRGNNFNMTKSFSVALLVPLPGGLTLRRFPDFGKKLEKSAAECGLSFGSCSDQHCQKDRCQEQSGHFRCPREECLRLSVTIGSQVAHLAWTVRSRWQTQGLQS